MVKCCECGEETGDEINYCLECADRDRVLRNKTRALEQVKSLDSFGAVIEGTPNLKAGAKRFVRQVI